MNNPEHSKSSSSTEISKGRRASFVQRIRVPFGFLFGIVYVWCSDPSVLPLILGALLAAAGLALRIWAAGHLRKHQKLSVSGPYRWTRNPLYLGSMLMGLGFCLAAASLWLFLVFAVAFPSIYLPVMRKEESELTSAYGFDYMDYKASTPLFVPTFRASPGEEGQHFSWQQVRRNREYNAAIGYLIILSFLTIKLLW